MIETLIILAIPAAIGAAFIAASKNRSAFLYFLGGIFFPFITLLVAIGIAPRQPEPADPEIPTSSLDNVLIGVIVIVICVSWIVALSMKP